MNQKNGSQVRKSHLNRAQMERIVGEALQHGDPRSAEYKLGAVDLLCRRAVGAEFPMRYKMGTVQADAYYAGVERGWMIWRRLERVTVDEDFGQKLPCLPTN